MKLKVKKLNDNAVIPEYQTEGAAGFDLVAAERCYVGRLERVLVSTGLAFEIPKGYELQIRSRSGLALNHGLIVINSPGTIDSDYRGEVKVIMTNHGSSGMPIEPGDRFAQAVLSKITQGKIEVVDELSSTERGEGGFGSTDI